MNDLYHWHAERMVDLEMKEINREIANANLLRAAGLSGTDWLTRAVNRLVKLFKTRGSEPQDHRSTEQQAYRPHTKKAAE